MKKEFLSVGKIVGTHGIRGMVRIDPWSDDPEFLTDFKCFYIDEGKEVLKATRVSPHGHIVIAAIEGIDSIEKAEKYRNKEIFIKRDDADLPEGRYFISEITGSTVYDSQNGKVLGTLTDVFKTGANDVWQVTNGGKDYLVPVIDDVVNSVDIDNGKIEITPLKGIFDDED